MIMNDALRVQPTLASIVAGHALLQPEAIAFIQDEGETGLPPTSRTHSLSTS
jgi:hypothetical protein